MARQRGFTHWRGGRSMSVSSEMQQMANKNSFAGEEEEGGVGWQARKCGMLQTRSLPGGGRGRNGLVSLETWHVAKWGLTCWRGGRGRSGLASSETWHVAKRGLTCWRGERGRRGLVSSEKCHATKRGLTCWRGERVGEPVWAQHNSATHANS